MAQDCGFELRKQNVTMVSLWPGAVQTEHMVNAINDPKAETSEVCSHTCSLSLNKHMIRHVKLELQAFLH